MNIFFKRIINKNTARRLGIHVLDNYISYVISDDNIVLEADSFSCDDTVKSLLKIKNKAKDNCLCYLSISNQIAMIKELKFNDSYTEAQLLNIIKMNASSYFAYGADSLYYDFESISPDGHKIRVLASKKEEVSRWTMAFSQAKLILKCLTIDTLALENFFIKYNLLDKKKVYAIIFYQYNMLYQTIFNGCSFVFVNNQNFVASPILSFRDELVKFLCLYEINKNHKTIDEMIILTTDLPKNSDIKFNSSFKVSVYHDLEDLVRLKLPLWALLPLGVSL